MVEGGAPGRVRLWRVGGSCMGSPTARRRSHWTRAMGRSEAAGHLRRLVEQHDVKAQAVEARQPGGGARAADDGVARNGAPALAAGTLDGRLQRTPLAGRGRRQPHLALELRSRPLLVVRRQLAVRRVGEHGGGDAL